MTIIIVAGKNNKCNNHGTDIALKQFKQSQRSSFTVDPLKLSFVDKQGIELKAERVFSKKK